MVDVPELISRIRGGFGQIGRDKMTDSANFGQLWPEELIEQATEIIMNRFDLDSVQALEMLRRMSQHARAEMCVVAEAIINHHLPVKAERILDKAAHG